MAEPLVWAGFRMTEDKLDELLKRLKIVEGDDATSAGRLVLCRRLRAVAREVGDEWSDAVAQVFNLQLEVDLAHRDKRRRELEESKLLEKLVAQQALKKPVEWRSRDYRRAELAGDEVGRKKAEEKTEEDSSKSQQSNMYAQMLPPALPSPMQYQNGGQPFYQQ